MKVFWLTCIVLTTFVTFAEPCQWVDTWRVVKNVTNNGFEPDVSTFTYETGASTTATDSRGQSSSSTRSQDSESSSSKTGGGGLNLGIGGFGLSASGSATSGSSSRSGSSATSEAHQESSQAKTSDSRSTKSGTITCPPKTNCVRRQKVRSCGNQLFYTDDVENKDTPIEDPATALATTKPPPITIDRPGETWILAKDVTFNSDITGTWERPESCAPSSFANGFRFKSGKPGVGLTRFAVNCSTRTAESEFTTVKELQSGFGGTNDFPWIQPFKSSNPNEQADGFVFQTWIGRNRKPSRGNWKLTFNEQIDYLFLPKGVRNVQTSRIKCPEGHAVCGLMTMLDSATKSKVTNLGLKCCYYCIPRQEFVTTNTFENSAPNEVQRTEDLTVGTRQESTTTSGGSKSADESTSTAARQRAGIHAGFAATFGSTSSSGYNWGTSEMSSSSTETKSSFAFTCPGRHKCVVQQLVGICGDFKIQTSHTALKVTPLDPPEQENLVEDEEEE